MKKEIYSLTNERTIIIDKENISNIQHINSLNWDTKIAIYVNVFTFFKLQKCFIKANGKIHW